jgi:anti-sigma B factor antagonist
MLEEELWSIDVRDDGNVLTVAPSGELDITTSVQLIDAFACRNGHTALVCDISGVTFIDSTGFQALLALQRDEPACFALAGTSPCVERLLELTGTAKQFRRVDS